MTGISLEGSDTIASTTADWPIQAARALDLLYSERHASSVAEKIEVQKAVQGEEFIFLSDSGAFIPEEALRTLEYKYLLERNFMSGSHVSQL